MAYRRELPDWKSEYLDPELETMSREQITALQVERLKATVAHCMNNPIYKERLEKAGVTPENITSIDDIRRIPFTTKQDLRENYPFGLASVPLRECVRLHSSSGTTGNPTVILHTQKDLDEWANQVARNLWMVGLRPDDVFQNSQTVAEDMHTLIDAFHADFPNGKVIISSPPLVDPRGGMGYSYGASATYYWNNIARRYYNLWQIYDDFCKDSNYSSFVKFAHTGIMMDIENAYKYSVVNVNTRLAVKELRGYNGAHPADCGCFQIADGIYNTLITL